MEERYPTQQKIWTCPKCESTEYSEDTVTMTGKTWSRFMNIQKKRFKPESNLQDYHQQKNLIQALHLDLWRIDQNQKHLLLQEHLDLKRNYQYK